MIWFGWKTLNQVNTVMKSTLTYNRGRRGDDGMVVGFITTYAISAYYHH